MKLKRKRSVEYRQNNCVPELHDELFEELYGGERILVFYVRCPFQAPLFLAEVGSVYAEAINKEEAIKALKRKLLN